MFRKFILILVTGLLFASSGKAQLADKATLHGGFSYQFVTLTPLGSSQKFLFPYYGLSLGMNYVLAHSNDQASIGISPTGNISFSFSNYGINLMLQAPVYLTARLGAGATPYNEQKFGIGAGIGSVFTYMVSPTGLTNSRLRQGWVNPSAMGELSIKTRFSNYLFRVNWSLFSPTVEVDDLNGDEIQFGNWGISILYNF
ncbi:MAG TPA: hypothetical protein ENJ82_13060 [Bacteroidetes bacterium]|nr:hypothetical protein [Bacteroidota bacterium]